MTTERRTAEEAQERVLGLWLELARAHEQADAEFEASVSDFFGGHAPLEDPQVALLAARRHTEWFVLERHSPALCGTPGERLLGELRERIVGGDDGVEGEDELTEDDLWQAADQLLRSTTGAFLVEEVRAGEGAWLRDLSGLAQYALRAEELSARLRTGDLLVGRIAPIGDGLHVASPAAGVFRGEGLVSALQRDLEQVREGPGAKLLRLSQHELERMFFGAPLEEAAPAPPSSTPEEALEGARAKLAEQRLDAATVGAIFERLGTERLDPDNLTPGAGDALGAILDELAFETRVDLDAVRAALVTAWQALSATRSTPTAKAAASSTPAPRHKGELTDAERLAAIEEFAEHRASGGDALADVAQLQEALGLDPDEPSSVDDGDSPAPDFPGVVGAMVHEFVWETGVSEGEASARELAPLAHLATFAAPIGVFEELSARDLIRFASFWVLERQVVTSESEAHGMLRALRRFGEWCRDAHELDLMGDLCVALDGLDQSLPRVVRANQILEGVAESDDTGEVFEVADDAATLLRNTAGEDAALGLPPGLDEHLALGDRVRGFVEGGVLRVARVYPPEAVLGR